MAPPPPPTPLASFFTAVTPQGLLPCLSTAQNRVGLIPAPSKVLVSGSGNSESLLVLGTGSPCKKELEETLGYEDKGVPVKRSQNQGHQAVCPHS